MYFLVIMNTIIVMLQLSDLCWLFLLLSALLTPLFDPDTPQGRKIEIYVKCLKHQTE